MSNITTEKANELFWLGRYVERVHTTSMEFFRGYDRMIDEQEISYPCLLYTSPSPRDCS